MYPKNRSHMAHKKSVDVATQKGGFQSRSHGNLRDTLPAANADSRRPTLTKKTVIDRCRRSCMSFLLPPIDFAPLTPHTRKIQTFNAPTQTAKPIPIHGTRNTCRIRSEPSRIQLRQYNTVIFSMKSEIYILLRYFYASTALPHFINFLDH